MNDDWKELEEYLFQQTQQLTKEMTQEANKILKKNVKSEVYDNYNPSTYTRSKSLQNSITSDETEGITYFDDSKLYYKSKVTGEDVSQYVPKGIDGGHKDDTGINNAYHNYPSRKFMEKTKKELESIYGEGCCEIVDNI